MAIEIRELVIKAIVVDDKIRTEASMEEGPSSIQQTALIQECVNQVLKIIKKRDNR